MAQLNNLHGLSQGDVTASSRLLLRLAFYRKLNTSTLRLNWRISGRNTVSQSDEAKPDAVELRV